MHMNGASITVFNSLKSSAPPELTLGDKNDPQNTLTIDGGNQCFAHWIVGCTQETGTAQYAYATLNILEDVTIQNVWSNGGFTGAAVCVGGICNMSGIIQNVKVFPGCVGGGVIQNNKAVYGGGVAVLSTVDGDDQVSFIPSAGAWGGSEAAGSGTGGNQSSTTVGKSEFNMSGDARIINNQAVKCTTDKENPVPYGGNGGGARGLSQEEIAALSGQDEISILGSWVNDGIGWKYQQFDKSFVSNGWNRINGSWYYFGTDGYIAAGWRYIDQSFCYFYPEETDGHPQGSMAAGTVIDGRSIDASGKCDNPYVQAANVLNHTGWNLPAAYNYTLRLPYYRMYVPASNGLRWFADFGFTNNKANCYVYAAMLTEMARAMGYDAHLMGGVVPSVRGGMTVHGWAEITVDGVTRVYDPDFQVETGRNGFGIWYGQHGTWRYTNYARID